MSELDDAVDVLSGSAGDGATLTHADVNHESTVVQVFLAWLLSRLHEELSRADRSLERASGHGSDPDRTIDELLRKQIDVLKVINVDLARQIGLIELLVELDLVELAQEVVLDPELLQLLCATSLREHELVEQGSQACISDEVPLDRHLRDLARGVSQDALRDALETCLSDSVVTQVKELKAAVRLECNTQGTCAIDIKDVAIERQVLDRRIGLEGVAKTNHARDTKLARAQIERDQTLVDFDSRREEFGSFTSNVVLAESQVSDLRLSVMVIVQHEGHRFHVFCNHLTFLHVEHQWSLCRKLKNSWPLWVDSLLKEFIVVVESINLAIPDVQEF